MKSRDLIELLVLAALWGGSFLFMRIAAPVLGPVWLIEIRVLLAGLVLLPLLARLGLLGELRSRWKTLVTVGALNSAIPFSLLAYASVALPTGFTSILNATAPLFGMIVAAIWLKEPLTKVRLTGLVLGFLGVVVLVGRQPLGAVPLPAVVAGLGGGLMYAIAAPYIRQNLAGVPSLVVTTGSQLGAALVLAPLLPFTLPRQQPTAAVTLAVLALAVLSTSLAYILYFRLINHIGSTRALTVTYLVPVFAILWGALVLREAVTLPMVAGCALVLLGTAIANGVISRARAAS